MLNYFNPGIVNAQRDPFYPLTGVILRFDGTNGDTFTVDESVFNASSVFGSTAVISNSRSVYGPTSLYLTGASSSRLTFKATQAWFPTADFTIEAWVSLTNLGGTQYVIGSVVDGGIEFNVTSSAITLVKRSGSTIISRSWSPVLNEWNHIAISRQSGSVKLFLNGVQQGAAVTFTEAFAFTSTPSSVYVGCRGNSSNFFWGYIDELRITHACRYTSNFTPKPIFPKGTGLRYTYNGAYTIPAVTNAVFTGVSFGTPANDRIVAFCVGTLNNRTVVSAKIGGVDALVESNNLGSNVATHILYAVVPSGTSGTVEIVFSGSVLRNLRGTCYSIFNSKIGKSAVGTLTGGSNATRTSTITPTVEPQLIIAADTSDQASGAWSGSAYVATDFDYNSGDDGFHSGSSLRLTGTSGLTVIRTQSRSLLTVAFG